MKSTIRRAFGVLLLFLAASTSAQTFKVVYTFPPNYVYPGNGSLVQGLDGNFYGTTFTIYQGFGPCGGTVFKITPQGVLTTLHTFSGPDGCNPIGGLVLGTDGNFYGTTEYGGSGVGCGSNGSASGCGTVFRVTPAGQLTTLYNFAPYGYSEDGVFPVSALVQAGNGKLYGTTSAGGTALGGTVFQITTAGTYTSEYSFCNPENFSCRFSQPPYNPEAGLIQAANGGLYGTVAQGGLLGSGAVFEMSSAGSVTFLYEFCQLVQCADGRSPMGALTQARNGNFYGTTVGTVFELTPAGILTTLYTFCSLPYCADGSVPMAGLIQATNHNFFGTTTMGGSTCPGYGQSGCGTVFEITPAGKLTTLHSFVGTDGDDPQAGLVQGTDGKFYGTTLFYGVVYSIDVGLKPFVKTLTAQGKPGSTVTILGNNLSHTSSVTFNGTAARFTVLSDTAIKAIVPTGATTGTVEVTLPNGTLESNIPFRVK